MIKTGYFKTEKLVNLSKHDYRFGAERYFHAGYEVDCVSLKHVRTDPGLCG